MSLQQSSKIRQQHIPALTGVRALAALLVLGLHVDQNVPTNITSLLPWIRQGYLGVDFFFILSGFIITHVYLRSLSKPTVRTVGIFLWHRFIRLYPVHVAVLLALIGMVYFARAEGREIDELSFNGADLIWQFSLVHAWGVTAVPTWNVPSWSISAEWFMYLLFPLIVPFLLLVQNEVSAFVLAAAALVVMSAAFLSLGFGLNSWTGAPALLRVAGEFLCGAALCRAISIGASLGERRWNGDLVGFIAFAGFLVGASLGLSDFLLVGSLALTVMGAATANGSFHRLIGSRPAVWIGEISFSIYMVHFPILIVLRRLVEMFGYASWH
jgi:peptidoglycan/LPS O-acetylase OafA/YrhL